MKLTVRSAAVIFLSAWLSAAVQAQTTTPAPTPQKSTSKVSVKYDRSKDTTTVTLKSMTLTRVYQEKEYTQNIPVHQFDFQAIFTYKGEVPTQPVEEVTLRFNSLGSNYIYLRGQEVIIALDRTVTGKDRAFSLGSTSYKSVSPKFNSVFEEIMELKAPADALVKLSNAESVEIFFGPLLYSLTTKQHDALKEFKGFLPVTK